MSQFPLGDITSANATLVLVVAGLFPAGIRLQQFATDQSYSQDELTIAEDRMGVDGGLVAGWIPSIKTVTVMLEASSPSYAALSQLYRACERRRGIYECSLIASVPSIGKTFTWTGGVLKSGTPVPSAKKVLDPTTWKFDFADLTITDAAV
ncbi:MAG: hypothetical protein J1E80_08010 [Desulfovibrionaceae bacterium]|nr:hypothetical protein [Desulfovibrionaceae bacterium]